VEWERFHDVGVVRNDVPWDAERLAGFEAAIRDLRAAGEWTKSDLVQLVNRTLGGFAHKETFRYLDERM
jgi:UDP-N-acetylglucosamine 4,6-dehydratase